MLEKSEKAVTDSSCRVEPMDAHSVAAECEDIGDGPFSQP